MSEKEAAVSFWRGRRLDTYTKEELIQIVEEMGKTQKETCERLERYLRMAI